MKKLNRISFSLLTVVLGISLCSCGGPKKYVITWKNYDGTVLEIDNNVVEGLMPSYDGNTPTKAGNAQYTYTFSGWSPSITTVTSDKTYKAQFSNTTNSYTITWDVEGSKTTETYKYGETPSYKKGTPTKAGNAQYTYTFSGWSPSITTVTSDKTYKAQFSNITNSYTITWKNWDGSVIKTTSANYGTMPSFGGSPTRENDAQHYYTFEKWNPEIVPATSNATYTASYLQHDCSTFRVSYNANGGSGAPTSQIKNRGVALTLSNTIPTFKGHVFAGWNSIYENIIYASGSTFNLDSNVTLYAMWEHGCEYCNQTGKETSTSTCSKCHGNKTLCSNCGGYAITIINGLGSVCSNCYSTSRKTCTNCNGKGSFTNTYDCSHCGGLTYILGDAPTTKNISGRSITLNSIDGCEYSIDGVLFQASPTFDDLHPNTEYTFYQRKAMNGSVPFGCISSKLITSTSDDSIYYIDYELDGGSNDSNNPSQISSSSSFTLKSATKEHYDFVGWKCNEIIITTLNKSTIKTDVTLVAIWSPHKYGVSFDLNGGSFNEKRKATVNYVVDGKTSTSTYEIGTKVKYFVPSIYSIFLGWYTDPYYYNLYNFDTPLYNNMTLYAKLYKLDSSEKISSTNSYYNVTSKNYTLTGSDRDETFYFAVLSSCTVTFGGQSKSGRYNFYNISNHSSIGSGYLQSGTSKSFSIQATATNPTILRVYFGPSDGNQQFITTGLPAINTATVYDSYDIDTPISLDNPVKKGYTFLGWTGSNGDDPSTNVSTPSIPTGDVNYTANWSMNTYTISYELNGGVNDPSNPTTYTIEDPSFYLKNPSKENYDFKGWKFNNSSISYINTQSAQNYVLTATWSPHTYSISYIYNGGTGTNPSSYNVESSDIVLTNPTKNGYTFIGWTGSNGDVPESNITIEHGSSGDRTYTANWSLDSYSITYVLYGGRNATKNPSSYSIEDDINLKPATKDYYDFDGWYKEPEFINKVENLNGLSGNLTLYAKFIPYNYSATFDCGTYDSSSEITLYWWEGNANTFTIKNGESVDLYSYATPSRNGYVFAGWYKDAGLNKAVTSGELICGTKTFYAKWISISDSKNSYADLSTNVYFYRVFGAGVPDSNTGPQYFKVPYNLTGKCSVDISTYLKSAPGTGSSTAIIDDITSGSNVLTKGNMNGRSETFELSLTPGHWYKIYSSQSYLSTSGSDCASSVSVRVTTVETNSMSLIVGGNVVQQQFENSTSCPTPIRDGYDFVGWFDENNDSIHELWDYTDNKNFHAKWSVHNYSINYNLNGGINNPSNPSSFVFSDYIELLEPQKDGYTFDGWYSDPSFKNKVTHVDGSNYSDVELYAKWIQNTYTATLDYGGGQNCPTVIFYSQGNIIKTIDLYKDSTLDYFVPESPSENLKFGGWYTDSSCTKLFSFDGTINADTSLYAKWIDVSNYQYSQLGNNVEVQINSINYGYIAICSPINQTITITSSSGLDLYGAIYDSNWNMVASCDDISDENLDFSIEITLEAGKIYYIGYKANQVSASGDCIISISGMNFSETFITGDYTQIIESISVTYDSSFELPTPKKEGYEFIGWFDENGNPIDTSLWKHSENITIYAHWRAI